MNLKYKYTMVILNWMRPKNMGILLKEYTKHDCVEQIIVSQGHKDFPVFFDHPKVQIINDHDRNNAYGLNLRYLNGLFSKTNDLIYADDDVLITKEIFESTLKQYERNPHRIVGLSGRPIDGYDFKINLEGSSIILTKFLVVNKEILRLYFVILPFFQDILKKGIPFGNGEDILLSLIAREYYCQENFSLGICFIKNGLELDTHGVGCDTWEGHKSFRASLCRCWRDNEHLIKSTIENYKLGSPAYPITVLKPDQLTL